MDEHTRMDRQAKRRYEALTEGIARQVESLAPGVWAVPSRSNPEDFHLVVLRDGTLVCDCEGAKAGQPCRHVEAVKLARGNAVYRSTVAQSTTHSPYPERKRVALT